MRSGTIAASEACCMKASLLTSRTSFIDNDLLMSDSFKMIIFCITCYDLTFAAKCVEGRERERGDVEHTTC